MIRQAKPDDLATVFELAMQFYEDFKFPDKPKTSPLWLLNSIIDRLHSPCVAWLGLFYKDAEPIGLLWLELLQAVNAPVRVAHDILLYFLPRRGAAFDFIRLYKAGEAWAREVGAYGIFLTASPGIRGKTAFLEGLRPMKERPSLP
jgi:hypothetical protein